MIRELGKADLRTELDRMVTSGDAPSSVRGDIVASWKRCVAAGLRRDRFAVPYLPDVDSDGPLVWAAAPVIDQVAEELEGSGIGLLLTDEHGHVVDRRADRGVSRLLDRIELAPGFMYNEPGVGTNAIGTAIAQHAPSVVAGSEHFVDALVRMACTASPISDASGRLIGVLDFTCAADDFSPLMLPLAKRAALQIGQRLPGPPTSISGGAGHIADVGMPVSGWPQLTETERIVAGLVADGLTNRQVADRMLVAPHTVDVHLRAIFRKLGIRSRVELARMSERAAAKARIVAAADDARRRIERDLHDGLQQRLVTLGLEVRRAASSVSPEDHGLKTDLSHVAAELMDALAELREISRGIYPAILSEGGLGPAISALARRSPVLVELDARVEDRLPQPVEVAAYYVVSEALTNTVKHAQASVIHVAISADESVLELAIRDDGVGGADAARGSGLIGLSDRIEGHGGSIELVSPAGRGTSLIARIPIPGNR